MSIQSTIPGALATMGSYFTNIQSQLPNLHLGAYTWGLPTASVTNNFIGMGNWETGLIVTPVEDDWAAVPGAAKLRTESYSLEGTIRTASGAGGQTAAQARINDAYSILNALHQQILNDPGATAVTSTGALTSSGSWGKLTHTLAFSGQTQQTGWMVVIGFELSVINAQLIG